MISKCLASRLLSSFKLSSKAGFNGLVVGDVFREKRVFTNADVVEYSKPGAVYVSQNLQFKRPVYGEEEIVGEVQAISLKELKKKCLVKFSTRCLKNDIVVVDGEAMAMLPASAIDEAEKSID